MLKWFKNKFNNNEKNEKLNEEIGKEQEESLEDSEDSPELESNQEEDTVEEAELETIIPELEKSEDTDLVQEEEEIINVESSSDDVELEEEVLDKAPEENSKKESKGFFKRLFTGLEKTRNNFSDKIAQVLGSYVTIDEDMYEDLEDILITADVGVNTTMLLIDNLRNTIKSNKVTDPALIPDLLAEEAKKLIDRSDANEFNVDSSPTILLVVGVNGVGKTTTIGKLASKYKKQGKKVLLVAADTFRAAATEQLQEWSNRAGVDIIYQKEGADPASVVFDAIQAAKARKSDIILCDTAGRLHNKANLMNELQKIYTIIDKNYPEANKESLIVLDATTGQNAIQQAKEFKEVVNVTGVVVTKLDGTAKGGIILPLINELNLPIVYIGVGEQIDDLQEFDSQSFIESIFQSK